MNLSPTVRPLAPGIGSLSGLRVGAGLVTLERRGANDIFKIFRRHVRPAGRLVKKKLNSWYSQNGLKVIEAFRARLIQDCAEDFTCEQMPVGGAVFPCTGRLLKIATIQNELTLPTAVGYAASQAACRCVHY